MPTVTLANFDKVTCSREEIEARLKKFQISPVDPSAHLEAFSGRAMAIALENEKNAFITSIAKKMRQNKLKRDADKFEFCCKYTEPQLIKIDGEPVSCQMPECTRPISERCNEVKTDEPHLAFVQRLEFGESIIAALQNKQRARIARLLKWPFCGHTQRNVSVVWIDDFAYWQCDECLKF